jgi:hypothetical protein
MRQKARGATGSLRNVTSVPCADTAYPGALEMGITGMVSAFWSKVKYPAEEQGGILHRMGDRWFRFESGSSGVDFMPEPVLIALHCSQSIGSNHTG